MPSLIEQLHLTEDQARRHYVELLERDDNPRDGDADLLQRVLDVLGRSVTDFREDVRAVDQAAAIEASYEDKEAISAKVKQARDERDGHEAETKRIIEQREQEHRQLDAKVRAALAELQAQHEREQELRRLRVAHRLAFGLEPKAAPKAAPAGVIQTTSSERVPAPVYRDGEQPRGPFAGEHEVRPHGQYE